MLKYRISLIFSFDAALLFLALLATMLIAFTAIIIFWLQSRRLKVVLEDMYARHQQLLKAVSDVRLTSGRRPTAEHKCAVCHADRAGQSYCRAGGNCASC